MLYRPALHNSWNALSLARRVLKDKFPKPTVPLTTVLLNRQVFLSDSVYAIMQLDVIKKKKKRALQFWNLIEIYTEEIHNVLNCQNIAKHTEFYLG
jgi:spermidine synthase